MDKARHFYTNDFELARIEHQDLGEWQNILVSLYPHKTSNGVRFIEALALTSLQDELERMRQLQADTWADLQTALASGRLKADQIDALEIELRKEKNEYGMVRVGFNNLDKKLFVAEQVIEFYGNKEHYEKLHDFKGLHKFTIIGSIDPIQDNGTKARAYLNSAKLEGGEG